MNEYKAEKLCVTGLRQQQEPGLSVARGSLCSHLFCAAGSLSELMNHVSSATLPGLWLEQGR